MTFYQTIKVMNLKHQQQDKSGIDSEVLKEEPV